MDIRNGAGVRNLELLISLCLLFVSADARFDTGRYFGCAQSNNMIPKTSPLSRRYIDTGKGHVDPEG